MRADEWWLVHQVVRDLDGNLMSDRMVEHIYTIEDDSIRRMDIHHQGDRSLLDLSRSGS